MIQAAEEELASLDARRAALLDLINRLNSEKESVEKSRPAISFLQKGFLTNKSPQGEKVALFRSLFSGREDVYARRFESARTGKKGYQPACRHEWVKGLCEKPRMRCGECDHRNFLPVADEVIRNHLLGTDPQGHFKSDFTIGVYPLLPDETCRFLTADFDKTTWAEDAVAFIETCKSYDIPVALERSRSGKGAHVWIFFSEAVPAVLARKMGAFILTETMERRPEIGLDSYDCFFPNQDTMPKGGFGNLIALPLQKRPREKGGSLFIDENLLTYRDQWAFLSSVRRMSRREVEKIVEEAVACGRVIGIRMVVTDEDDKPWRMPPSGQKREPTIRDMIPEQIDLVLGNQIYIAKDKLPPALTNRLIRLAAFQNPEFYKAQALRLSTYNKPRIISCCEDFSKHIGLPRGCLDDVKALLQSLDIKSKVIDGRFTGTPINTHFTGALRPEQQPAAEALLHHDTGVLSATTAFGKTVIAAYLIARRGVNTLILVHRKQLLDQWIDRLRSFLDLDPEEIGQIGGGKRKPLGIIDIATIQSLSKKGIVDDIVGEYGHLVVDECHHISARSFEIVARQCKATYVTGLSATVTRKDGHHPIIFMQCGPVRYRVSERKEAAARPFNHMVIVRNPGFILPDVLKDKRDLTIHELYSALIGNDDRNNMIIADVLKSLSEKRFPLLLTERLDHLALLADRLSPIIRNVIVFKGGMGRKQRRLQMEKMTGINDKEERVIIATGRYLGEGFDDARLDTLFLTLPVSWRGTLVQYAGRLHRLHDMKKDVIIYDYADIDVPMLAKMYEKRRRGYKAIGYET